MTNATINGSPADIIADTSVKYYGATGNGSTDDTAAFSLAAKSVAAQTILPYDSTVLGTPVPVNAVVDIPPGTYKLTSRIDTGGREITWNLATGVAFSPYDAINFLTGRVNRQGTRINAAGLNGIRDNACGFSVVAGTPNQFSGSGITGFAGPSDFTYYFGREDGGLYVECSPAQQVADRLDTTFTATRVTFGTALSADAIKRLRVGMIIDSLNGASGLPSNAKWSALITGWDAGGTYINVSAWYKANFSPAGSTGTPSNGTRIIVNPVTKVFAQNVNAFLTKPDSLLIFPTLGSFPASGNSAYIYRAFDTGTHYKWTGASYVTAADTEIPYYTKEADGVEYAVISYLGGARSATDTSYTQWGVDSAFNDPTNVGGKGNRAFSARGNWWYGYMADATVGIIDTAFRAESCSTGLSYQGSTSNNVVKAFDASGNQTFRLGNNGSWDLGNKAVSGTVYWDVFTSGAGSNGDVRFFFAGGNTTHGRGQLTVDADIVQFNVSTTVKPFSDNVTSLGAAGQRWTTVYAATGTINTSDARHKRDIAAVEPAVALSLIEDLTPRTYKWNDDQSDAVVRTEKKTRQKVERKTVTVEAAEYEVVDGKAIRRVVETEQEIEEPVFEELPIFGADGEPLYDPNLLKRGIQVQLMHRVPVMEDYEEEITVTQAYSKKNVRTHYGFIAQEVEEVLQRNGLSGTDFAGLVKDQESGIYGLRYDQFIPVLWSAVQQLLKRVETLEQSQH